MHTGYRDFVAYSAAAALGDEFRLAALDWSRFDRWTVGLQLVRALDSVSANVAEAYGRWQPADKRRLLVIGRGSLCEADHWLLRAHQRGLIDRVPTERLDEIARALSGLIRAHRR